MPVPQLGVGLVYWPALRRLFESGAVSVLELEPQTLWEKVHESGRWCYRPNTRLIDEVAALTQRRLLHGVGQPLGGSTTDPVAHFPLLRAVADQLRPAWVSEHLSFNRVDADGRAVETGFLLPPQQSAAGVRVAAANVVRYRRELGRPVAFETGANYLQRADGELSDGSFFAAVAAAADCGILLDLHNLWCNELNGGPPVREVVAALPRDRVWEVHLAGGMELSGYWLDAHSGLVPEPLLDLAAGVIAELPNLGALNFEVLPEHVDTLGVDAVHAQLERQNELWRLKPTRTVGVASVEPAATRVTPADGAVVSAWERALLAAINDVGGTATELTSDPGVAIYRQLIRDARTGSLTRTLRYTVTALLAGLGEQGTATLLDEYAAAVPPDSYPAVEADHFATFLGSRVEVLSRVPWLDEVIAFEHALARATVYGVSSDVRWSVDPTALLAALADGRLPDALPSVSSMVRLSAR